MNPVEVLQFVGIPLGIGSAIVILGWWLLPSKRFQPLGVIVAVGISSVIAFILQEGVPTLPPTQRWHWLVFTVTAVSLLACIYPCFKKWDNLIVLQALIAGLVAGLILQFPSQQEWYMRCLVFVMVLFAGTGLRRVTIPAWHMYLVSWVVLAGLSILALQSSFAKLAFYAGAMSAVAASMCVLQLLRPRETKSVQIIYGTAIVGCTLCGFAYDQGDTAQRSAWFLPMASIPLSAICYVVFANKKYRAVVSLAVVNACVIAAIVWSIFAAPATDEMWP